MWEKVVTNLVSNAFKFTPGGEVAVRLRERDDCFVLEVADTGVGIPEAELGRVFERFHRAPSSWARTHEGTGIGLSLVRELVEAHGGRIGVKSVVGQGTTFTAEIPQGFAHLPLDAVESTPAEPRVGRGAMAHVADVRRWVGEGGAIERDTPGSAARANVRRAHVLWSTTTQTCARTSPHCSPPSTRSRPPRTAAWPLR
jgi:hypothetical protein